MTFNPDAIAQDLVWLVEIEAALRLEDAVWLSPGSLYPDIYYTSHPEGKPSRVRECLLSSGIIVPYAPDVADLATCQATPSSWYWDGANLYIHASTGGDPASSGMFLINSYFWENISDRPVDLFVDSIWHPYRPLLDPSSIADLSFEATQFSTGGISQSFGSVRALNGDGYWDARLANYVYEGKRIIVRFGKYGDDYGDYIKLFDGYTGGWTWTDGAVVFDTEDPRRFQE
jgi:hypothetical protein